MDAIQKTLIKAGRKDLAQKYFKKIKSGYFSELDASFQEAIRKWKGIKPVKVKDGYEFGYKTHKGIEKRRLVLEKGKIKVYITPPEYIGKTWGVDEFTELF